MSDTAPIYACPVCGHVGFTENPFDYTYDICPQCGVEFGNDDANTLHSVLRERWIAAGSPHWQTKARGDSAWVQWYNLQLHPRETDG